MTSDIIHQEHKISELLDKMSVIFTDLAYKEMSGFYDHEDADKMELIEQEEAFLYWADKTYKLCLAYIETKGLLAYLQKFENHLEPILKDRGKALEKSFSPDGDAYSNLTSLFWSYLNAFPTFGDDNTMHTRAGITYLENILESTGVIINELKVTPTSESQVYNAVKLVAKSVFPASIHPTQSFQKTAKCYIPDILIPSLNCAVEYKYAETETALIRTIDEILIDVKGYDDNPTYRLFYAVFYVKPGIWTEKKFKEVWDEKKFPKNWKGMLVVGQ